LRARFPGDPVVVSAAFHPGQTTVQNWLNDSRYSADSQSINLTDMAEGPTKNYATRVLNAYAIYLRMYYEGGAQTLEAASA
jgi:soluble lytic murein transglycosylase-like protein